jgi:hypothetical protein
LTSTIAPPNSPSRFHVIASNSSSSVPHPPGNAITASTSSIIRLAFVQVIYDQQLAQAAMTPFEVVHETRQHSDHAAAPGNAASAR